METLHKQTTSTILMIEPVSFRFNDQTALNNYFQQNDNLPDIDIQSQALAEFTLMVEKLRAKGLNIIVVQDIPELHTPDSIFPNNWISFHHDGRVTLYPMYALNRRAERRNDIIQLLADKNFRISDIVDYTAFEQQNRFLEGTGSMVPDHLNKIAYAAISERTDKELFLQFCKDFDFKPVCFFANQTVGNKRLPIYHTNVMMCIGDRYAVVCLDAIDQIDERNVVIKSLVESEKEIIEMFEGQMHRFACNVLQVENKEGVRFLVISQSALDSLTKQQIEKLTSYNELISVSIPTIEKYGGGGVRCMMAEVFMELTKP
jgi:hypothetical protein